MQSYRDLDVYQRASALFPRIYKIVRSWKTIDQQELGSQLIRSANSIHANIAEGLGKSKQDARRYLGIALGSSDETASHLKDALNVGLIDEVTAQELISAYEIVGKQLNKLRQK